MTVDIVDHAPVVERVAVTRRPGIVDRLLGAIDSLPGPASLSWAAIGLALAAAGHLIVWFGSARPLGQIYHDVLAPAMIFAWFMWLTHALNQVGTSAFKEFRPALGYPANEDQYLHKLTSIDDRWAAVAAIVTVAAVSIGYYVGVRPTRGVIPVEIEVVAAPLWGLVSIALGIVIYHTITQLRLVSHLSAIARNVDIFKPAATNALSRLTAVSALGLIAFVVAFVLFSLEQPLPYIIEEAVVLSIAVASFVLPLRVMHNRLAAEKKRLLSESQDRLKVVLDRLHGSVEANDLASAEQVNHQLTAILAEQDVLAKLHTWPWSATTIRGFVSALVLPIALIVLTQVIDRLI